MKRRYRHRDRIAAMSMEPDAERIYRLTTLYDFGTDARVGLNLAFYRTFAVPHIAELLIRTGEMTSRPTKRAYDTGLIMYELIAHGVEDPRGREMIRLLNRVHRPWPIADADFRYVLAAFIVVPLRWIDRRGWRPLLDVEREASARFYGRIADLMGIPDPPRTYTAAAAVLDDYERRHLGPSDAGRRLMQATQAVITRKIARRAPSLARRLGPPLTAALIDDPALGAALGLPHPPRPAVRLTDLVFTIRNLTERLRRPPERSWFQPGRAAGQVYPHGYAPADLGPAPLAPAENG